MSSEVVLKVENIGKRYEIYEAPHHRLLQTLLRGRKQFYKEFWALKDISFEVKKGECLGIIGRNGCGKSTLLQIIAGTLAPTTGSVKVNGKVAALLELGSGFNPEFTGRENVYMNGAIMGLSRLEMDKKFDEIAAFADIGEFIDQPVKIYSSGMYVRLAFAAAINVDPDILIIDESLAVGDMLFQLKCIKKIDQLRKSGLTLIFVSHDVGTVKKICERVLWIMEGRSHASGETVAIADSYSDYIALASGIGEIDTAKKTFIALDSKASQKEAEITRVEIVDEHGKSMKRLRNGTTFRVRIAAHFKTDLSNIVFGCAIFDSKYYYISGLNTALDSIFLSAKKGNCNFVGGKAMTASGAFAAAADGGAFA